MKKMKKLIWRRLPVIVIHLRELCRVRELLTRSSARLQQAQQLQLQQQPREATPTSGNASFAELVSDLNTVSAAKNS